MSKSYKARFSNKKSIVEEEENGKRSRSSDLEVAIDFGASKTAMTKHGAPPDRIVDSTFAVHLKDDKVQVIPTDMADDALDEEQVVRHFKHKMGLTLEQGSSRPKLYVQYRSSTDDTVQAKLVTEQKIIEDIFYQIIKNLLNEQATFLFGNEKRISPNQVFLISYPNTDSVIQKIHYQKLWKKTLARQYIQSGWNGETDGEIHMYPEAEAALFSLMGEELDDTWNLPTVIVDQGDSTTNVALCLVTRKGNKTHIAVRSSSIRIGGADYTSRLSRQLPTNLTETRSQQRYVLESKAEGLKDRLLNKKQDKIATLQPFRGTEISWEQYCRDTRDLDAKICEFVKAHIEGKMAWKRVILTGGGTKNTQLQEALKEQVFHKLDPENYICKHERVRVCQGLFYRHQYARDPNYIIEECSPHSFYVMIADGHDGFTLFRILKKFQNTDVVDIFSLVANGNTMVFPVFQVNSKSKQIKFTDDNRELLLQRIGDIEFPTEGIKSGVFTPQLRTTFKSGELETVMTNTGKHCNFIFDWQEILEANEGHEVDALKYNNMQTHSYEEHVAEYKKFYKAAESEAEISSEDILDSQESF